MDAVRLVFCEATALHYTLPECGSTQRVNALKSGHRVKYKKINCKKIIVRGRCSMCNFVTWCSCVRARARPNEWWKKCMTECVGTNGAAQWPLVLSRCWLYADTIKEKGNVSLKVKTTKKRCNIVFVALPVCLRFCFLVVFVYYFFHFSLLLSNFVDAATTQTVTCFRSGFYWLLWFCCFVALFFPLFFYSNTSQKATASKYRK